MKNLTPFSFTTVILILTAFMLSCGDDETDRDQNYSPKIKLLKSDLEIVEPNGKANIELEAYDVEGDAISVRWNATGGEISGDQNGAIWIAPEIERRFQIDVHISDGNKTTNGTLIIQVWRTRPGDYYPLAVGNIWNYRDDQNHRITFELIDIIQIQTSETETLPSFVLAKYDPDLPEYDPILAEQNPEMEFRIFNFSYLGREIDENGKLIEILQHAQNVTSGTEDTIMFDPFLPLYKFPLIPGNYWHKNFQAKLTPELFPIGGGTDEFLVISEETISVPAGTFDHVFQVEETFRWKFFDQELDETIVQKWLAPNVGLVKFTQMQTRGEVTVEVDFELESYELIDLRIE